MMTVRKALYNTRFYLTSFRKRNSALLLPIVEDQFNNAILLLERGYGLDDDIDDLLSKFGTTEQIPNAQP